MTYKIIDIEGVGDVYAPKLIEAGIKDTDALLEKCAKPAGRKALEEATGISHTPALSNGERVIYDLSGRLVNLSTRQLVSC